MMDTQIGLLSQTLAAIGIGLLIGLEREYHLRRVGDQVKHPGAAGIRTFALIALSGNLLTWLPEILMPWGISLGMAFIALMALFSYRRTSNSMDADPGITTEIVMVVTFILGTLTGLGYLLHATVVAAIVFCLLRFKKVLHHFSHSLSKMDLTQATQFLIISAVVLPILPNTTYGPYGALNPQRIWLMVVLISGIGFAAYATIKVLGQRAGLGVTGFLGGMASSTAVTLAMSRLSRANPSLTAACQLSIIVACATMFPRVTVIALLFSPDVSELLILPVAIITLCAFATAAWLWRRSAGEKGESGKYRPELNPLSWHIALSFGAFYAMVLFLSHMAQAEFGSGGIMSVAGISGLSDVDAITLSVSEMSREHLDTALAARAILLACAANSFVKWLMGLTFSDPAARPGLSLGLLPMAFLSLVFMVLLD